VFPDLVLLGFSSLFTEHRLACLLVILNMASAKFLKTMNTILKKLNAYF